MKFQRSTFLLVLAATLMMGGFFVSEVILGPRQAQNRDASQGGQLFDFEESDITAFQVQRPDLTLAFEKRDDPPAGESTWLMKEPEEIAASDGAVAFLLNLVATGSSQQTLEVEGDRKTEFGFDRPAIVNVTLANGDTHTLILGLPNFDRSAFYALSDTPPNADKLPVQLVSVDFDPAINRPLEEWKYTAEQPPSPEPSSDDETSEDGPEDSAESEPPADQLPSDQPSAETETELQDDPDSAPSEADTVEPDAPEPDAPEADPPEADPPEAEAPEPEPSEADPSEPDSPLESEEERPAPTSNTTNSNDDIEALPPGSDEPNSTPTSPES